ncbi:MAG: hypothetical protein ACR65R_03510 [Methylomicrobium sp.]
MKAIEKASNPATAKPVHALDTPVPGFAAKKFWLTFIFGAGLIFIGNSLRAEEQQRAGSSENVLAPPTGLRVAVQEPPEKINKDTSPGQWEGTSPHMNKDADRPSEPPPRRDTTFDTEEMNKGPAPNTENINKDTVGPGGDNMMRDAIPGGSGLKRE